MTKAHIQLPSLTGLRGVAALLVVVAHLRDLVFPGMQATHLGEIGVMLFFSLSGFLMALLYLPRAVSKRSVLKFVESRFARIAPAYLFVVCTSYLISQLIDPSFIYHLNNSNIFRHLLFSGNQAVFWSIPPEVQFYGIFVVAWFSIDSYVRHHRRAWLVLVSALGIILILERQHFPGTFVGASFHFFLFGAVAGRIRRSLSNDSLPGTLLAFLQSLPIVMLLCLSIGWIGFGGATNAQLYASLWLALGATTIIFAYSFDTALTRVTLDKWLPQRCGECSFSIYLINVPVIYWSEPMLKWMGNGLFVTWVIIAVVAASYAVYRTIEIPGGRMIKSATSKLFDRVDRPLGESF